MIGKVLESSVNEIVTRMEFNDFEQNKENLKIGKYVKIAVGNYDYLIASIKSIKAGADVNEKEKYLMTDEPVGVIRNDEFISGSTLFPSPTEEVDIAVQSILDKIFQNNEKYAFPMGRLVQNNAVSLYIDGNAFFKKHKSMYCLHYNLVNALLWAMRPLYHLLYKWKNRIQSRSQKM